MVVEIISKFHLLSGLLHMPKASGLGLIYISSSLFHPSHFFLKAIQLYLYSVLCGGGGGGGVWNSLITEI